MICIPNRLENSFILHHSSSSFCEETSACIWSMKFNGFSKTLKSLDRAQSEPQAECPLLFGDLHVLSPHKWQLPLAIQSPSMPCATEKKIRPPGSPSGRRWSKLACERSSYNYALIKQLRWLLCIPILAASFFPVYTRFWPSTVVAP